MQRYRIATPAKKDVVEILEYLLEHAGGRVALETESKLRAAFQSLATHPQLGHKREDLTSKPVLFSVLGRYHIVYRIESGGVLVLALLDGARDVKSILRQRSF